MLKFLKIGLILGLLSGSLMAKVHIEHNAFIIDPNKWEYLVNSKNLNKKLILKSRLDENLVGYFDNEMAFLDKDKNFSEKSLAEEQCSIVKKSLSENKTIVGSAEVKLLGKKHYCVLNTTVNGLENSQYWFVNQDKKLNRQAYYRNIFQFTYKKSSTASSEIEDFFKGIE